MPGSRGRYDEVTLNICIKFLINKNVIFKRCRYIQRHRKLGNTDRIAGETGNAGDVVFCPLPRALGSQNCGPVP